MKKFLRLLAINFIILVGIFALIFGGMEIYLRAKKVFNVKTFTAVGLPIYEPSHELSWEHKKNFAVKDYYGEDLALNCRGQRSAPCRTAPASHSVLLLGDSFTFGINAPQSSIFPLQLEKIFGPEFEVQNAAAIGYSIDQYAAYIKKYILDSGLKPSAVVLNIFVGNDITELRRHTVRKENGLPTEVYDEEVFVGPHNTLESYITSPPLSLALYQFKKMWDAFALRAGFKKVSKPTLTWPVFLSADHPAQDPKLEEYWEKAQSILKNLSAALKKENIPLVIVLIPMDVQVSKNYMSKYPGTPFDDEAFEARRPQKRFTELFQKEGINFIDLLPELQKNPRRDELYFEKNDPHFSVLGHRVVAEILASKLKDWLSEARPAF